MPYSMESNMAGQVQSVDGGILSHLPYVAGLNEWCAKRGSA